MKKILLASNQEAFVVRNRSLLNRAGFLILTATSAEEALQTHRRQSVDLIISLLDLPDTGGDSLFSMIRQEGELRQVPLILVCYDTEADLERAAISGANAWVTRPVHPELLLKQVGRFLDIPTRRDYRAIFNASVHGRHGSITFSGVTRNISVSGILCEAATQLQQDDLISNMLLAIDSHPIVAEGKVVWVEGRPDGMYLYGVQFISLAAGCRERIEQFVESAEPA